ncbi:MAG: helix-turn-helix domain-containing protein [Chloroflexota bacterium]
MTLYVRPVSEQERSHLNGMIAQASSDSQNTRAHIVLLSSQGYNSSEIASLIGRHPASVRKWIHRFNQEGLTSLTDAPSPGRKRSYGDEQSQRIVEIALTEPRALGQPYRRWSLHRLVRYLTDTNVVDSISHDTVWRILRTKGIHFKKGEGWSRNNRGAR